MEYYLAAEVAARGFDQALKLYVASLLSLAILCDSTAYDVQ